MILLAVSLLERGAGLQCYRAGTANFPNDLLPCGPGENFCKYRSVEGVVDIGVDKTDIWPERACSRTCETPDNRCVLRTAEGCTDSKYCRKELVRCCDTDGCNAFCDTLKEQRAEWVKPEELVQAIQARIVLGYLLPKPSELVDFIKADDVLNDTHLHIACFKKYKPKITAPVLSQRFDQEYSGLLNRLGGQVVMRLSRLEYEIDGRGSFCDSSASFSCADELAQQWDAMTLVAVRSRHAWAEVLSMPQFAEIFQIFELAAIAHQSCFEVVGVDDRRGAVQECSWSVDDPPDVDLSTRTRRPIQVLTMERSSLGSVNKAVGDGCSSKSCGLQGWRAGFEKAMTGYRWRPRVLFAGFVQRSLTGHWFSGADLLHLDEYPSIAAYEAVMTSPSFAQALEYLKIPRDLRINLFWRPMLPTPPWINMPYSYTAHRMQPLAAIDCDDPHFEANRAGQQVAICEFFGMPQKLEAANESCTRMMTSPCGSFYDLDCRRRLDDLKACAGIPDELVTRHIAEAVEILAEIVVEFESSCANTNAPTPLGTELPPPAARRTRYPTVRTNEPTDAPIEYRTIAPIAPIAPDSVVQAVAKLDPLDNECWIVANAVSAQCSLLFVEKVCSAGCKQSMMAIEACAKQGNPAADDADMAQLIREVSTVLRTYESYCQDVVVTSTQGPTGGGWISSAGLVDPNGRHSSPLHRKHNRRSRCIFVSPTVALCLFLIAISTL